MSTFGYLNMIMVDIVNGTLIVHGFYIFYANKRMQLQLNALGSACPSR